MKKSRIAKFALLGASTAALAATLTTSTYAWYVSNKTANVNAVTGSTTAGTSDNTIALSTTGKRNEFFKTITLADKDYGLSPVLRKQATLSATGTKTAQYYALDESANNVVLKSTAESSGWYEYQFYILASVNCTVSPVLTVTNTTENFSTLTQVNYSTATDNKITGGVSAGEKFTTDALKACRISLAVETGVFASDAVDAAYAKADTTTAPSEYTSLLSDAATLAAPTGTSYGTVHPTGGAHDYYEFMTSKTLDTTTKVAYTGSALGGLTLTAGTPVKLVYSIWLDGASDLCFNACQGQTLSVAFNYTATPTTTNQQNNG